MANIVNQYGQVKVGVRVQSSGGGGGGGIDADAQAFITAASITDSTQQSAINTLVTQLKGYGIWTKLKAVYPFVGGNASAHKFNLKDPRDLDAAFRLTFNGGWTHSSTGALPNGTTGYADTKLIPNIDIPAVNNMHYSVYFRNNFTNTSAAFGIYENGLSTTYCLPKHTNGNFIATLGNEGVSTSFTNTSTSGNYIISRTSITSLKSYKNGTLNNTNVNNNGSNRYPNYSFSLGALRNSVSSWGNYFDGEHTFASIGDGLTDTDAANLYTAVQTFQTTLGRNVGAPIVADTDAQAFLNAAEITSQIQANAIDTLVTDLKSANIWTKMKAIYPFVGGTATSHKFNLKDPRDLDAAYRLVFNGGSIHNSTGYVPNLNSYADTKLNPSTVLNIDSVHFSYYSRTNSMVNNYDMGVTISSVPVLSLTSALRWGDGVTYYSIGFNPTEVNKIQTSTDKNFIFNKITTSASLFENTTKTTTTVTNRSGLPNGNFFIAARNLDGTAQQSPQRNCAFSSIGDGLTDAEAVAFYTAVQKYQTTLGRQV